MAPLFNRGLELKCQVCLTPEGFFAEVMIEVRRSSVNSPKTGNLVDSQSQFFPKNTRFNCEEPQLILF